MPVKQGIVILMSSYVIKEIYFGRRTVEYVLPSDHTLGIKIGWA